MSGSGLGGCIPGWRRQPICPQPNAARSAAGSRICCPYHFSCRFHKQTAWRTRTGRGSRFRQRSNLLCFLCHAAREEVLLSTPLELVDPGGLESADAPAVRLVVWSGLNQAMQDLYTNPVTLNTAKGLKSSLFRPAVHDRLLGSRSPIRCAAGGRAERRDNIGS